MRKLFGRLFKTLGIAIVIVIAGASAILFTPLFSDLRRTVVASYLSQLGDHNVKVKGNVDLVLGKTASISVTELDLVEPGNVSEVRQHIDSFSISFPLWSALLGNIQLNTFELEGARVVFLIQDQAKSQGQEDSGEELAKFISSILIRSIPKNLSLSQVVLEFKSPNNGWNEKLEIENLSLHDDKPNELETINGRGRLNSTPIKLVGNLRKENKKHSIPVNLALSIPGSTVQIEGDVDISKDLTSLDLTINSETSSMGDLLVALGLKRVLEGKGNLTSRVKGPINAPGLSEFRSTITGAKGMTFEFSGLVDDIYEGTGIDLNFSSSLPTRTEDLQENAGILDIDLTGFSGNLSGSLKELALDNLILQTNVASAEVKDIGPISIGSITKDSEGRLGIRDIRVLDGPPENRTLDLKGEIADALQLKGISLNGELNIATADLFKSASKKETKGLGRFKGLIAISDKDESIGIDKLEASVVESDLIALHITHSIADLKDIKDIEFDVELSIPNFKSFAEALGESSKYSGQFGYSGVFALKNQSPKINGKLNIGKTQIVGNLKGILQNDKPHLVGTVESKLLYLRDLAGLLDVLGLKGNKSHTEVRADNSKKFPGMSAEITIKIDKIAGQNRTVGNIDARLLYGKKVLTLDPLRVSYLGGLIRAKAQLNSSGSVKQASSSGSITKLPVGRLLNALGAPEIISGSITTKFNIRGSGDGAISWIKSLSGNVNTSISGGSLGTNLIDLSGLNLVTWLTTSSAQGSVKLVCAVLPINFKNGRGTTQQMVLETQNVQVVGRGSMDIRNDRVNLNFVPLPKRQQLVDIVSPFSVTGRLSRPSISVKHGAAGRVAAEVVTLPLNVLGLLVGGGQNNSTRLKPCVVPTRKPKAGSSSQSWKPKIFFQ